MRKPAEIARIAIEVDDDGVVMYWLYNVGTTAEQGGLTFGNTNSGYYSLKGLQQGINAWIERDEEELIRRYNDIK